MVVKSMRYQFFISTLDNTLVLLVLLLASAVLTGCFSLCLESIGGQYLDTLTDLSLLERHVNQMSDSHKFNHIMTTATLDTLYPLVYGAFMASLSLKFARPISHYIFIPIGLLLVTDFTENLIQILILNNIAALLLLKVWLTSLKFILVCVCLLLCVYALLYGFFHRDKKYKSR